jgi:hypothetical protein
LLQGGVNCFAKASLGLCRLTVPLASAWAGPLECPPRPCSVSVNFLHTIALSFLCLVAFQYATHSFFSSPNITRCKHNRKILHKPDRAARKGDIRCRLDSYAAMITQSYALELEQSVRNQRKHVTGLRAQLHPQRCSQPWKHMVANSSSSRITRRFHQQIQQLFIAACFMAWLINRLSKLKTGLGRQFIERLCHTRTSIHQELKKQSLLLLRVSCSGYSAETK